MNDLPYLKEVFERLRRGTHLSPEDEPEFSAVSGNPEAYIEYFARIGLTLVHHHKEFFYFEPDVGDNIPDTLPRIAAFSYIMVDHVTSEGRSVDDYLLTNIFLVFKLPHFNYDRYADLMRQVGVKDEMELKLVLRYMDRIGWVKFVGEEEFRFLRPFHRVLDKCIALTEKQSIEPSPTGTTDPKSDHRMTQGPQKLILIHSGRYDYAEVELDGSLQIVGPNNAGKTTLINTLQFLYLDDRGAMEFGTYTPEQTRDYYFPDEYSYILFQCLGSRGQFVLDGARPE
ncbi:MAG: hypothetical protein R2815_02170 [Flavobacteriales bacterium]